MADFTVDNIVDMDGYDPDIWGVSTDFSWWALSHNFDVVGAILAMAELSWEKGFQSGLAVKSLTEPQEDIENARHELYPNVAKL